MSDTEDFPNPFDNPLIPVVNILYPGPVDDELIEILALAVIRACVDAGEVAPNVIITGTEATPTLN